MPRERQGEPRIAFPSPPTDAAPPLATRAPPPPHPRPPPTPRSLHRDTIVSSNPLSAIRLTPWARALRRSAAAASSAPKAKTERDMCRTTRTQGRGTKGISKTVGAPRGAIDAGARRRGQSPCWGSPDMEGSLTHGLAHGVIGKRRSAAHAWEIRPRVCVWGQHRATGPRFQRAGSDLALRTIGFDIAGGEGGQVPAGAASAGDVDGAGAGADAD